MLEYSFDPILDKDIIYLVLGISFLVLTLFEILRKKKTRLGFRVLLIAVLILSLAMSLLRPQLPKSVKNPKAVVLTDSADPELVDSIQKKLKVDLFTYKDSIKDLVIPEYLNQYYSEVHVVGDGISSIDLSRITNSRIYYYPPNVTGMINVSYNPVAYTGELTNVSFDYASDVVDTLMVWLKGQGRTLDSLSVITSKGITKVNMEFAPELEGNFLYSLEMKAGDIFENERIAISVLDKNPLKVLISNEFPSFEIKYLKDILKEENRPVVSRFKVGKNLYSSEFSNMSQFNVNRLTDRMLEKFDVLITTVSSLYSLNQYEKRIIRESVESGMGIILLLDDKIRNEFPFDKVDLVTFSKTDKDIAISGIQNNLKTSETGVNDSPKLFPMLVSENDEIISGYVICQLGKAGFINLSNMYSIQLKGDKEIYSDLALRLTKSVRRRSNTTFWRYDPIPIKKNVPIGIQLATIDGELPKAIIKDPEGRIEERYFKQSIWDKTFWSTNYTPQITGWHSIENINDSTSLSWFYVDESQSWESNNIARSVENNKVAAHKTGAIIAEKELTRYSMVNQSIWLILFTLSAGFLWLESKL